MENLQILVYADFEKDTRVYFFERRNMKELAWLFPLLFIVHDMEEIIGFGIFLQKNERMLREKYPFAIAPYRNFSTEGFALAVMEELLICLLFSYMVAERGNRVFFFIWLGGLIGCTLHFGIHIMQSLWIRKYIPALLTSIFCLPFSIWLIGKSFAFVDGPFWQPALGIVTGVVIVAVNIRLAQKLIGWFTIKVKITPLIQ